LIFIDFAHLTVNSMIVCVCVCGVFVVTRPRVYS
jgi:hypothetical protein